ncbi:MAG: hypothetical protein JO227_07700 [Acetobacteraceae bacterium]|nr:hypothetical protein [Acetobacteraceae bacterium]
MLSRGVANCGVIAVGVIAWAVTSGNNAMRASRDLAQLSTDFARQLKGVSVLSLTLLNGTGGAGWRWYIA